MDKVETVYGGEDYATNGGRKGVDGKVGDTKEGDKPSLVGDAKYESEGESVKDLMRESQ